MYFLCKKKQTFMAFLIRHYHFSFFLRTQWKEINELQYRQWRSRPKAIFSNFSCMFLNPNNSNCSNLLDLRNLQEQVKKAFYYQKLFRPFTVWINCSSDLKFFSNSWPSASNFKSFSRSLEQFFLTVGQNNFGNKIPFLNSFHSCNNCLNVYTAKIHMKLHISDQIVKGMKPFPLIVPWLPILCVKA